MSERVKLSRVAERFEEQSYPASRETLAEAYADTTVTFADGEANLGDLVAEIDQEEFHTVDDLLGALQNVLPVEAVGEPGQSEGDA